MSAETVNQMVARLIQPAPLSAERFAALLGTPLQPSQSDPFWTTYTFELPAGPFAAGELRLRPAGDGALLILSPRAALGLAQTDVDRRAWGQRLTVRPNPNVPPAGTSTETFQIDGVQLAAEWTLTSRRLLSLALEWPAPQSGAVP